MQTVIPTADGHPLAADILGAPGAPSATVIANSAMGVGAGTIVRSRGGAPLNLDRCFTLGRFRRPARRRC